MVAVENVWHGNMLLVAQASILVRDLISSSPRNEAERRRGTLRTSLVFVDNSASSVWMIKHNCQ